MTNDCYYDSFDKKENLHFDSKVVHGDWAATLSPAQ